MSNTSTNAEVGEVNGTLSPEKTRSGWVKFEDESSETNGSLPTKELTTETTAPAATTSTSLEHSTHTPAVLKTETVQVNLERGDRNLTSVASPRTLSKNVEFVNVLRHGFCKYLLNMLMNMIKTGIVTGADKNLMHYISGFAANGDIIVTVLPVNTKWPWITSAQFRPELVPEELMAQGLTVSTSQVVHIQF